MSGAASRSIYRLEMAINAALSEEYDTLPGRVDSATRLSYLLGLQRAIDILKDEIKKGNHVLSERRRGSNRSEV